MIVSLSLLCTHSLRRLLLVLLLMMMSSAAAAQQTPAVRIVNRGMSEADLERVFESLEESRIPSGLLVDQVAALIDPTLFDGTPQAPPATVDEWRQLYHQLSRSGIGRGRRAHARGGRTVPELPSIDQVNAVAERHLAAGLVPLAVLNTPFARIKSDAFDRGRLSVQNGRIREARRRGPSAYDTHHAFAVTAFDVRAESRSVRFVIPSELSFSRGTRGASTFRVDFGDGLGDREVRAGDVVEVEYDEGGLKEISFSAEYNGQTYVAATTLEVSTASIPTPDLVWSGQRAQRGYAGGRAGYSAYFFYGQGNTAPTRPVVFVEGFDPYYQDPANRRTWEDIYEILLQEDFVSRLRALGYDAVIMKLDNATDYVQRNAFALEHLLRRLRGAVPAGEKSIVVGPSMGGLIGRYALSYMERHGIPHNVRLFASLDAPQQAANFPLGVQFFLEFNDGDSELAAQGKAAVNSVAARQMLAYQYQSFPKEDPLRTQLVQELSNLGYPATRNIAIANGSGAGQSQLGDASVGHREMRPGDKIVEYRYRSWYIALDGDVWALPDKTPETQIFEGLKNVVGPHYRAQNVYVSGTLPYDNAPGGSRGTQKEIADSQTPYGDIKTSFPDHSWIPTVSALDLETPVLSYNVSVDAAGLTRKAPAGKRSSAHFDAILYPEQNEPHVFANVENVDFLLGEIDTHFRSTRTIAEARTFNIGQDVTVADGARITFTKPVSMAAGVRFSLGTGARLYFKGPVTALGTEAERIVFERLAGGAWDHLDLHANGNVFEYTTLDGGTKTVEVRSRNNVFRNCVFVNGWRGVSSNYAAAGGRSSFALEHSIVAGNGTVGIVAYHSDPTIEHTTIRDNGQAGLWLTDAFLRVFHRSVVMNNGRTQASRSGIEVMAGGYVGFLAPDLMRGYTRVEGNAWHEVYISPNSNGAVLGYLGYGGHNAVFDTNEGSSAATEMLLRNTLSEPIYADATFWGGFYPGSQDISGPVLRGTVLYQDPTSGTPSLGAPLLAARSAEEFSAAGSATGRGREGLRNRMAELRSQLQRETPTEQVEALLHELFVLQQLDHDDRLGERAANRSIRAEWRMKLDRGKGQQRRATPVQASIRRGAEVAALLEVRETLLDERYEDAAMLIEDALPHISQPGIRRTLLLEHVAVLEHEGRFGEALALLDEATASVADEEPAELYDIIRMALNERLSSSQGDVVSISYPGAAEGANSSVAAQDGLPEGVMLGSGHPNPFNPLTTMPYYLGRRAHVRIDVHDVLGRRVAVLVDRPHEAGEYSAQFDAGPLPSGVYLVRALIRTDHGVPQVLTRKVTLMK